MAHPRRLALALAAVCVLVLLGGAWMLTSDDPSASESASSAAVLEAARSAVVDVMSYDYRTIDQDMETALEQTADPFRDTLSTAMESNRKKFVSLKATAEVEVVAAAVQQLDDDSATVLMFVDQTVQNTRTPGPTTDPTRVIVTLVRVAGEWRISELELT